MGNYFPECLPPVPLSWQHDVPIISTRGSLRVPIGTRWLRLGCRTVALRTCVGWFGDSVQV
jgi:hypothetical protein